MRNLGRTTTAAALLCGAALLGTGTAQADSDLLGIRQSSSCLRTVLPVDAVGAVGVGSGLQSTNLLPIIGCSNSISK
ncbi:hypothetical protein K2224_03585 [Streptomyces sp. BHT-5-2]|uniref:hypothetical protein n=1 Tax=unclassified Streptomyces TaxID=2593676 RepID=UPI001C8DD39B|nr:hypothetical protein [Streptomyces sp. BHT-5-2]QZL02413.1 hypothetical protein K2224_03585 [Streptomyces sp. BHT-5-2]